jgi:hypothetical protein
MPTAAAVQIHLLKRTPMRLLIITNSTLTATIEEMNHFFLLARR